MESRSWDGRLGVVVGSDIAIYGNAVARPTGGAGAVALAVGPNAPLQFEPGLRASHVAHDYDFFKPDLASEYPTVDGRLSNRCFLRALDACYALYVAKFERRLGRVFDLDADVDYVVFHSPYCKLVQRAFARLVRACGGSAARGFACGTLRQNVSHAAESPLADLPGDAAATGPPATCGRATGAVCRPADRSDVRRRGPGQGVSGGWPRYARPATNWALRTGVLKCWDRARCLSLFDRCL